MAKMSQNLPPKPIRVKPNLNSNIIPQMTKDVLDQKKKKHKKHMEGIINDSNF